MAIIVSSPALTSFWVNKDNVAANQTGHILAPFTTVAAAVAAAVAAGHSQVHIHLAPGDYSSESLSLAQNIGWTFEGAVSGATLMGAITWSTSGNVAPLVPQSYLVLRNCAPASLTVVDGTAPAVKALLILENSAILGNLTQTGTGNVIGLISGISTGYSTVSGPNVSSLIAGNVSYKSALGITNTQILGTISGTTLWLEGCQVDGAITLSGISAEFDHTIWSITPHVTFSGAAGVLKMDHTAASQWYLAGGVLTNGTISTASPVILRTTVTVAVPKINAGLFNTVTAALPMAQAGDQAIVMDAGNYWCTALSVGAGTIKIGLNAVTNQPAGNVTFSVTLFR